MAKKLPEHLPLRMVLQLANAACEKYGFTRLSGMELRTMYTKAYDYPAVIRVSAYGMLWVDKWYVAVQHEDDEVEYLYLTRHHINEEAASCKRLKGLRDDPPELPEGIKEQFRLAHRWMTRAEQHIYFSAAAKALNIHWITAWREAATKGENNHV